MRVVFCNIASMKYYKGIVLGLDEPQHGGNYVENTGDAYEKLNFFPMPKDGVEQCFGFFETKSTKPPKRNQVHIEKLDGISHTAQEANNVLVVWCASIAPQYTAVVGWYKNATVYREYQTHGDSEGEQKEYNVKARASDCVLLPEAERKRLIWRVYRKVQNKSFGFGQANIWFAQEESATQYVQQMVKQIDSYLGENWLHIYPNGKIDVI